MAFGKITKEDLVAAGLDPDKLAEFQAKGVTKEMLDALEAKMTTTIADTIKTQFAELEGKLKPPTTTTTTTTNNSGGDNKLPTPEEEMADYLANPTDYINRKTAMGHAATIIENKKLLRSLAYKNAINTLPGMKNAAIKEEVDKEWEKYTPELFARNNGDPEKVLEQVYHMIMGKHMDDITRDANKKDGKYNIIQGGGSSSSFTTSTSTSTTDDGKPKLTEAEKAVASKFGMSEDEWIKQEKDMNDEELTRRKIPVGLGA